MDVSNILTYGTEPVILGFGGWGVSLGLSLGLSSGLRKSLKVESEWVNWSFAFTIVVSLFFLWETSRLYGIDNAISGATGALIGFALGLVVARGLITFAAAWETFNRILLPLIGFFAGYLMLAVIFAGFFAVLSGDPHAFVALNMTNDGHQRPTSLSAFDLLYFSLMNLVILGDSAYRPASIATKYAAMAEGLLGLIWIVGVFAAVSIQFTSRASTISSPENRVITIYPLNRPALESAAAAPISSQGKHSASNASTAIMAALVVSIVCMIMSLATIFRHSKRPTSR